MIHEDTGMLGFPFGLQETRRKRRRNGRGLFMKAFTIELRSLKGSVMDTGMIPAYFL